jgi:hypothetical protein
MTIPARLILPPSVYSTEESDAEYFGDTIGQYISRINCPQLEHLIIEGHHTTGLTVPAVDAFPNLKFFEIIHTEPVSYRNDNLSEVDGLTEDDDLQTLAQLKQRDIAFRYGGKSAVLLLEFLHSKYARNESEFTDYTLWLLKSEYRLQDPSGPFVLYVPDIWDDEPRNRVLSIAESLQIDRETTLHLSLHPNDRPSILSRLGETITTLDIAFEIDVGSEVISRIISELPQLRNVIIRHYAGSSAYDLDFFPSLVFGCTYFHPRLLLPTTRVIADRSDEDEVDCFKFSIKTGWSAGILNRDEDRWGLDNIKWYDMIVSVISEGEFGKIATTTKDIKSLNPMLEEVVDYFFSPEFDSAEGRF